MRSTRLATALAGGLVVLLGAAAVAGPTESQGPVRVEFEHPERFADAVDRNPRDDRARDVHLDQIARYVAERAAPLLRPEERLSIVITELNRAGGFEPWRAGANDPRIVRNVYPVRIDLRFRLQNGSGAVLEEGERELRDSFFLSGSQRPHDPLRYEKALLDDWLEREFANRPA